MAAIQKPNKKEIEDGTGQETLVFSPKFYIAKDSQGAAIRAARDIPADVDLQKVEVLVRPFV